MKAFLKFLARDSELQAQLKGTTSLDQVVKLAEERGFAIPRREFELWAHCEEFDAPWWPWAGGDQDRRQSFFRGD